MDILIKRLLKTFLFSVIIITILWSIVWFYIANNLKSQIANFNHDKFTLIADKIEVSGFPFKVTFTIENGKFSFLHLNSSFTNLTFSTNLLLNKLTINFPTETKVNFTLNNQLHNLRIDTNKRFVMKLEEMNTFNTFRIINALKNKTLLFKKLDLSKFYIHADELLISNDTNKQVIAKEKIDCLILSEKESDIISNSNIKIHFVEDVINTSEHILHKLKNIKLEGDIQILSKKDGSTVFLEYADFNTLNLKLNETTFSLKGNVEKDKTNDTYIKFLLTINNWLNLLDDLYNQNIISKERYDIALTSIYSITGIKSPNSTINIKIFNDPVKGFFVGNVSVPRLMIFVHKFLTTQ